MTGESNVDRTELDKFETLSRGFWNPHGEFRPLHLLNPVRMQFIVERTRLAGIRVLDVGCGGGLLAETLARAGANVTAIDLAPGMIDVAREHAASSGLTIDYRVQSAESLGAAEPHAFHVVTCMELLEHVPDPQGMLVSLATLVRPGGQVFVSTIHRSLKAFLSAIVAAEYVLGLLPRGTHEYERLIRPSELARWGRGAELELAELAGLSFDPFSRRCNLTRDVSVNYLVRFVSTRSAGDTPLASRA
jgi:2-polyprenyl-6-hydroxyphenyl methylase / 3-demethylubiquinone-9 3-methyltransferase